MVRTKAPKAERPRSYKKRSTLLRSSTASTATCDSDGFAIPAPVVQTLESVKEDLAKQYEALIGEHKSACETQRIAIKRIFNRQRTLLSSSLNKPIRELFANYKPPPSVPKLKAVSNVSLFSPSIMQDRTNTLSTTKSSTAGKPKKILATEPEQPSMFKQPIKTTRNSLRLQTQKVTASSTKVPMVTPMNTRPLCNMPAVTPKVNMNTPLTVVRRPRMGEVAMSMEGSPLMVSAIPRDEVPTICVPLPDGRVMSILPHQGISADQLPLLDEDLRAQLETLQSNLALITGQ